MVVCGGLHHKTYGKKWGKSLKNAVLIGAQAVTGRYGGTAGTIRTLSFWDKGDIMYDFFDDIFTLLFVAIPLAILGLWKLIELIIFIFSHVSITIH